MPRGPPYGIDDPDHVRSGRTAIVTRLTAQSRPSSSVSSTSQTQVVRPRWTRRAMAWIVPSRIERRKVEWFDMPRPMLPSGKTPTFVPNGGECLRDRRVDAAVHEPDRLQQVLAHRNVGAHDLVGRLVDLETVVAVEG